MNKRDRKEKTMHKTSISKNLDPETRQVIRRASAMRVVIAAARKYAAGNTTTFPSFADSKKIKRAIEIVENSL